MSPISKVIPLSAALLAGAAYAQPAPRPEAAPGPTTPAPKAPQTCPMMNGQRMMNGRSMGAHMQSGHMVDKDGKAIAGGMMGPHGMMCVPQSPGGAAQDKAAPKAGK